MEEMGREYHRSRYDIPNDPKLQRFVPHEVGCYDGSFWKESGNHHRMSTRLSITEASISVDVVRLLPSLCASVTTEAG